MQSLCFLARVKPDSVPLNGLYHLSDAAYPSAKDGPPLNADIHSLAGCGGVPKACRHAKS